MIHIIGEQQTGKSTLLKTLALADIKAGLSVAYLTPFDDIDDLLLRVPGKQVKRTVLFDPTLPKLISWNPLEETTNVPLLANTFTSTLKGAFGIKIEAPNIEMMVRSLIYTALEFDLTLLDCLYLLKESKGHESKNPVLKFFWDDYYAKKPADRDNLSTSTFNKLYALLLDPKMQQLFSQKDARLSIKDTVKDKTLFIRLPITELGEGVVNVLGSLLLAQLYINPPQRIYVDGMRYFAGSIQAQIVSVLGKFGVRFAGTHNNVEELDPDFFAALTGNCETHAFKVSPKDTEVLMRGFLPNKEWRLESLQPYQYRVLPWEPAKRTMKTTPLPEPTAQNMIERITNDTIQFYC